MDDFKSYPALWNRPPDPPWKISVRKQFYGLVGLKARHYVWAAIEEAQSRGTDNQEPEILQYLRLPEIPARKEQYDILLISNVLLPPRGGGTRSFLHFARGLAQRGLKIAAICMGPAKRRFQYHGIDFQWLVHEDDLEEAIAATPHRRLLCQQHWSRRAAAVCRAAGRPYWVFLRSTDDLGPYGEESFSVEELARDIRAAKETTPKTVRVEEMLRGAEYVVANSQFMADVTAASFALPRPPVVVYPGINAPQPWEKNRTSLSQNVLAMAGSTKKGMKVVLDLALALPDQPIVLCGVKRLPTWIKEKDLPENLFWLGQLAPHVAYALGKLVVMPSQWPEPAGRVNAEAVMRGLPILASRAGGIPEILPHDAFLVTEFRSSSAWVEAMLKILPTLDKAETRQKSLELGERYLRMEEPPQELLTALQKG